MLSGEKTIISLSSIKSINKIKSAKILDNSLLVITKDGKSHRFTHFVHRDNVYNLIVNLMKATIMNKLVP